MAGKLARITLWVAGLLALAAISVFAATERRMARRYEVAAVAIATPSEPASLERGRHLVEVIGQCTTCHGADLAGAAMADDPWLGRLFASNLTPGRGGIANFTTADLVRSIRHGVKRDGRSLLLMPAQYFNRFSDADLGAIIAHLRRLPPVDRVVPEPRIGPVSRLALFSRQAEDILPAELIDHGAAPRAAPPTDLSTDYGAYLVETGGCKICHHENLAGGLHALALPGEPPPANLRPDGPLGRWSESDFLHTLRSGTTPEGRNLDEAWMPWPAIARMSDLELRAIWRYLRSLPVESGPAAPAVAAAPDA